MLCPPSSRTLECPVSLRHCRCRHPVRLHCSSVTLPAYLGAAASIMDKTYLTVAGSILTTEARHQAWVSSAVNQAEPWSGPYDTPVAFSPVYSVAAQFIKNGSCPASNGALPFTAFPALTYMDGKVAFEGLSGQNQYVVLYQGLNIATYPIGADGSVALPETQGIAYITVSTEKNATLTGGAFTSCPPNFHLSAVLTFPPYSVQTTTSSPDPPSLPTRSTPTCRTPLLLSPRLKSVYSHSRLFPTRFPSKLRTLIIICVVPM